MPQRRDRGRSDTGEDRRRGVATAIACVVKRASSRLHAAEGVLILADDAMPDLFDLTDRVYVITGATGVLAGAAAEYVAASGARVAYVGRNRSTLDAKLARCRERTPAAQVMGLVADVLDRPALVAARDEVLGRSGRIDGLLNAACGNQPGATVPPEKSIDDLDLDAFRQVVDLNSHGTVLPTLAMVPAMVAGGRGSIVNYSSAAVAQAVISVAGYSAGKGAVEKLHPLAGRRTCASDGRGGPCERARAGLFRCRAKSSTAHERRRIVYAARTRRRCKNADGAIRLAARVARRGSFPVGRCVGVRHRRGAGR